MVRGPPFVFLVGQAKEFYLPCVILDVWVDCCWFGQSRVGHNRTVCCDCEVVVFEGEGEAPEFPASQYVALMRLPAMLFASCSVMAFIFSVVGGPTIMSRGRSSMLALKLSRISKEKEKGAITGIRMEPAFFA